MSILIKGMEMPKNCRTCPRLFDGHSYRWCNITGESLGIEETDNGRDEYCPLIELPPHGRLGDLDALQKQIENTIQDAHMSLLWKQGMLYARGLVEASKTVIEAEGSEE